MSYYTDLEFTYSEERPPVEAMLNRARTYLTQAGFYAVEDVMEQLAHCLKVGEGDIKGLVSEDIEGLMKFVSAGFPGVIFYVRGMGEEFSDIWLRLFQDGAIRFRAGPFNEEFETSFPME